jgi:hypothetical protein
MCSVRFTWIKCYRSEENALESGIGACAATQCGVVVLM